MVTETTKSNRRRRVLWSELPSELLLSIAHHLVSRNDIINFRRVCKSWRHSAPLSLLTSKHILSPLFPHTLINESRPLALKVLVANSIFLVKSAVNPKLTPWLFSVEELNPGEFSVGSPIYQIVTRDLPEDFPYVLDLSRFHVLELASFHTYRHRFVHNSNDDDDDDDDDNNDNDDVSGKGKGVSRRYYAKPSLPSRDKVVLFVNPNCEFSRLTIDECSVVELTNQVPLTVKRLKDGEKKLVIFRGRKLDDIINFKGKIYGIDRRGRVCSMDYHSLKMTSVAEDPLSEGTASDTKKQLAVSCGELYLIYTRWRKGTPSFKVFKLNEEEEEWVMLDALGDDTILFVTSDGCFFALTKDFPRWRGNCIVSPKGSFAQRSGIGDHIALFHFESGYWRLLDNNPGYSDVLWPPPSWLWNDACETEEDDEEDIVEEGNGEVEGGEEEGETEEEGNEEMEGGEEGEDKKDKKHENHVQATKGTENVEEDVDHEEFKDQNNVDSALAMNSSRKVAEKDVSHSKFQGVDVSSHLVPILQKIWDKHGNIMEGHVVNSNSLLTWALESLAKTIIILQSDSGRSLDESEAKYLKSILLDFRLMHFKIDWLVPFVEKALALHKNRVIMELEMAKSRLQTELCEVEERLAARGKIVPESQLVSLDLKDVLN